jgi:hypothetical protein
MQKYNVESANIELNSLESVLASKVEYYLKKNDTINAAKGLIAVNKELYKIEEDGRKLRLTGQLDVQVYEALTKGYKQIADRIMNIAYKHNYAHEVSVLHKALRFTNDAPTLADYLREANE